MTNHLQPLTLESLITRYRRAAADPTYSGAEIELEVRFRGVDFYVFETVLRSLSEKKVTFPLGEGTVIHTVNSIMEEEPAMRRSQTRAPADGQKASLIRQLTFDSTGAGKKTGERFVRKWPLAPTHRVRSPNVLSYNVALSAEEPLAAPFTSDAGALLRVKSRASFPAGAWRLDLTVVRTLHGVDAQAALPGVVAKMFRTGQPATPANLIALLDLADPDSEYRSLYEYEIELEHVAEAENVRPSGVTALTTEILLLANPEYLREAAYQAEIHHVATFVVEAPGLLRRYEHEWGLKRLVPQVVALTRGEYLGLYPPTGYFLLDKADGVRAIASVRDGRLLILADELLDFPAPSYLGPGDAARTGSPTIVDGELVRAGGGPPVFHAFDVIALLGENLAAAGYEVRVGRLAEAVGVLRDFSLDARPKPVVRLTGSEPNELRAQFRAPAFENRPYVTDGRILVEPGKPYSATTAYKWKSLWDTTIDFLARRAPASVVGRAPFLDAPGHRLHFLFVGISPDLFEALGLRRVQGYRELFGGRFGGERGGGGYAPVQFAPSDAPLAFLYQHPLAAPEGFQGGDWPREVDGKVLELRCAGRAGACAAAGALDTPPEWQLVRVREDRTREVKSLQYFGNDFRVAELTWLNYVDPLKEDQLWEGVSPGYFAAPKAAVYRAQTAFTSFVKSQRIEAALAHASWVVDAAIGKGQDLGRYIKASVRHVVGVDLDPGALSELIRRKFSYAGAATRGARRGRFGDHPPPSGGATALYAVRADLRSPHGELAGRIRSIAGFPGGPGGGGGANGADALVINLAFHYLCGDVVHIRNFAALCRDLVKVGGLVIITTMSGERVHDFLAARGVVTGASWDAHEGDALKYSIRRGYAEDRLTPAGQRISVLLPFSAGAYYDEFLVNTAAVIREFTARGFACVGTPSFDSAFDEFRVRNPAMHRMLLASDFDFLRLFGEIILKREK